MSDRPPTRDDGPDTAAALKPTIAEVAAWLRRTSGGRDDPESGETAAEPEAAPVAPTPPADAIPDQPELAHPEPERPTSDTERVRPEGLTPMLDAPPPPSGAQPPFGPEREGAVKPPTPVDADAPGAAPDEAAALDAGAPHPPDRPPDEDMAAPEADGAATPTEGQPDDPPHHQPGLSETPGQDAPPPAAEAALDEPVVVGEAVDLSPSFGPAVPQAQEQSDAEALDGAGVTSLPHGSSFPEQGPAAPEAPEPAAQPGAPPDEPQLAVAPDSTVTSPSPPNPLAEQSTTAASTSDHSLDAADAKPTVARDMTELTWPDHVTPGADGADGGDGQDVGEPRTDSGPTGDPIPSGSTAAEPLAEVHPARIGAPQADTFDLDLARMAERARASAALAAPTTAPVEDELEHEAQEAVRDQVPVKVDDERAWNDPDRPNVPIRVKEPVQAPVELEPVPADVDVANATATASDIGEEPTGEVITDDQVREARRDKRAPRPRAASKTTTYPRGQLKERTGVLQRVRAMLGVVVVTVLLGVAAGAAIGALLLFMAFAVRSAITSG